MKFPVSQKTMVTLALSLGLAGSVRADEGAKPAVRAEKALATKAAPAPAAGFWKQHLQFLTLDLGTRYRYIDTREGRVTSRDQQYKISSKLQINFVPEGRTYIQMRGETGSRFNSSWSNTGMGLNDKQWVFNMKSFYFGQKLGKHFEAQAGGLEFDRGVATEASAPDNDGFLTGYRGMVSTAGKGWLPNKVVVTVGFVGDLGIVNVYNRLYHRMDEANYAQVLVQKAFNKKHEASAEYNTIEGIDYVRGAYRWKKVPARVFDELQLEVLSRATENATFGWSTTLGKSVGHKNPWKFALTYSDIPKQMFNNFGAQVLENGDWVSLGKRMGGNLTFAPIPTAKDFNLNLHASRRMDASTNGPRWRAQVVASYKLAGLANKLFR